MALVQFETEQDKRERERKKFRIHVDQEVERFTRGQDAINARREQEAEAVAEERQSGINFQRQKFRELIAPSLDRLGKDINDERDRIDGERTKFRKLIEPSLQEAQKLSVQEQKITGEREKFRRLIQPSLDSLAGVGGGFDMAGGVPATDTTAGEATVTAQTRNALLGRAINEEVPDFFPRMQALRTASLDASGVPTPELPDPEITPRQSVALIRRLDAGEFGGAEWPDNVGLRQQLQDIVERGVKSQLSGGRVGGALDLAGDIFYEVVGREIKEGPIGAVAERAGRALKAEELVAGRLWEQLKGDVRSFDPLGNYQGIGSGGGLAGTGLGKGDTSQIGQTPNDIWIALRGVVGGEEDEAALDRELTELGLDSRILGPIFISPANYLPLEKLGVVVRGLSKIKFGKANVADDAVRFTVDVMKRADVNVAPFSQAETVADISGRVGTDITPRGADVVVTGAADISGRVSADFAPRVTDVPLPRADIAASRTGDVSVEALRNLSGADINRAGTSITRAGLRAGDVSVGGGEGIADIRLAGEGSAFDVGPGSLGLEGLEQPTSFDEAVGWYRSAIDEQRTNILDTKGKIKRGRAAMGLSGDEAEKAALARGDTPEEAFRQKRAAQKGDLTRATQILIEPPENVKAAILKRVNEFDFGRGVTGPDFERDNVKSVLFALSGGRDTPITNSELLSLEKVLGKDFVDTLRPVLTKDSQGFWNTMFELVVMPKAILSSLDLSYPFRQGIMAAPGHVPEFARSFGPMIRAGWSERGAKEVLEKMLQDPYMVRFTDGTSVARGQLKQQHGLLRTLDPGMSTSEEVFRSSLAEKLTGPLGNFVRRSNRSFTMFGNKFRSDMFDTVIETWARRDIPIDEDRVLALSNMLNRFTGRGTLGAERDAAGVTKAIQAVMWAPQYRLSGPQALATLRHPDRKIAAEAWRNMAAYMGTGMMILTAADITGAGEVGVDPLSGDFGKIKIGNIRINIWGTNAVLARTIARALTAQRALVEDVLNVESGLPEPFQTNPLSIGWTYARSGFAPQWSLVADLKEGENIIGGPVSLRAEGLSIPLLEEPKGLQAVAERNLVPLWLQDVAEAFQEEGLWGAVAVAPGAFFGVGISAYGGDPSSQMREMPKWKDVPLEDERALRDFIREVEQEYSQARRDHPNAKFTQAEVALDMGRKTDRKQLGNWAAGSITGKLPLNEERMTFALDNQDELDDRTLAFALPVAIARKYLSDENFKRYNEVEK